MKTLNCKERTLILEPHQNLIPALNPDMTRKILILNIHSRPFSDYPIEEGGGNKVGNFENAAKKNLAELQNSWSWVGNCDEPEEDRAKTWKQIKLSLPHETCGTDMVRSNLWKVHWLNLKWENSWKQKKRWWCIVRFNRYLEVWYISCTVLQPQVDIMESVIDKLRKFNIIGWPCFLVWNIPDELVKGLASCSSIKRVSIWKDIPSNRWWTESRQTSVDHLDLKNIETTKESQP